MAAAKGGPSPRPGVLDIAPYVPGTSALPGAHAVIKLSSNETPLGPSPRAIEAYVVAAGSLSRYPDGSARTLREAICKMYGLNPGHIVCGAGSDELLNLLAGAYLGPGDEAIYSEHGFLVYKIAIMARGATAVAAPETELTTDVDAILARVTDKTRVVFIANPNNPTGTWIPPAEVKAFLAELPREVVVVLDEAYDEYLEPAQRSPSASWIAEHPNLIVSRTFSKAYGLAGLRVGFGIMDAVLADLLNRVRQPFNVNSVAQAAALAALADSDYVAESAALNRGGLSTLMGGLDAMRVGYIPSNGNFILIHVGAAAAVYEKLLRQGIIVRPVANYGLPEHLRVTVGLPEENARFLEALKAALGR